MYLSHTKGCNCCVSRKVVWNLSMKRHAYGGANLVPIAVPETCCLILLLNSKKLFFSTNCAILTKSSVRIHFMWEYSLSKASLRAVNPTSWGILGYNPTTSTVTKIALSGIVLVFLVLFMKSPGSLNYDQPFCMIGFKWWLRNSENFSLGLSQLEITGLPRTLWSLL